MIQTTAQRAEESSKRLFLRSAAHSFEQIISIGTNCSSFEASVISQKAQEVFHLGEYGNDPTLQPGQLIWRAVSEEEPAGKPLDRCIFKRIRLTIHNLEDDREILVIHGHSAKRGQQIMRICTEALDQGTLLTQEDLATLLDSDVKTIRNDIKRYQKRFNIVIPTRGNKKDIGPGITHREHVVEQYIQGKDPVSISRDMKHSLKAVERYIQTFCRVVYCQAQLQNSLKTALVVGVSVALINRYLEIKSTYLKTPQYRERLTEIEAEGTRFWEYHDSKKKYGQRVRRKR